MNAEAKVKNERSFSGFMRLREVKHPRQFQHIAKLTRLSVLNEFVTPEMNLLVKEPRIVSAPYGIQLLNALQSVSLI